MIFHFSVLRLLLTNLVVFNTLMINLLDHSMYRWLGLRLSYYNLRFYYIKSTHYIIIFLLAVGKAGLTWLDPFALPIIIIIIIIIIFCCLIHGCLIYILYICLHKNDIYLLIIFFIFACFTILWSQKREKFTLQDVNERMICTNVLI